MPLQSSRIIFITGRFQVPFHNGHDRLFKLAIARAKATNGRLLVITGPSDREVLKYENGILFEERQYYFKINYKIPKVHIVSQKGSPHAGPESCRAWVEEIRGILAKRVKPGGEVELIAARKEIDIKVYLQERTEPEHYADLLVRELGLKLHDVSLQLGELINLSSSEIRNRPFDAALLRDMPPAAFLVMAAKRAKVPWRGLIGPIVEGTREMCNPEYVMKNILDAIERLGDEQQVVPWPKSIQLNEEPESFRARLKSWTSAGCK
jgi:hypothetical protein